jgi:hypothetical protein
MKDEDCQVDRDCPILIQSKYLYRFDRLCLSLGVSHVYLSQAPDRPALCLYIKSTIFCSIFSKSLDFKNPPSIMSVWQPHPLQNANALPRLAAGPQSGLRQDRPGN